MSVLVNSLRGIHILTPRNFVQAAGMYNTMLSSDEPSIIVEPLNAYRSKEKMPNNIADIKVSLGMPEIIRKGSDITIVTYGSIIKIAEEASVMLEKIGISCEIIDVQTLLPFDINHSILGSIKKTNRVVFLDEDVPGGCTAYMMQKVLEEQNAYKYLDSKPITISAKEHRPSYSSDGDYFSKPNSEEIFEEIYNIFNETDPRSYPDLI